jgi:hypothetical protein
MMGEYIGTVGESVTAETIRDYIENKACQRKKKDL